MRFISPFKLISFGRLGERETEKRKTVCGVGWGGGGGCSGVVKGTIFSVISTEGGGTEVQ